MHGEDLEEYDSISLPDSLKEEFSAANKDLLKQGCHHRLSPDTSSLSSSASSSGRSTPSRQPGSWSDSASCSSSTSSPVSGHDHSDSGVASEGDESDEVEDAHDHCDENCFCHRLKAWLADQAVRERNILDDTYYLEHKDSLFSVPVDAKQPPQCTALDPIDNLTSETFRYAGEREKMGRIHGRGTVYFPSGRKFCGLFDKGIRSGQGDLYDREGVRILGGNYVKDRLHGVAEIATFDSGVLEVNFVRGVAAGPARRFSSEGELHWIGRYQRGEPTGICWRSNDSEGWYVGQTNRHNRLTDPDSIYLYPDFHTALVGKWDNDCMKEARLAKVTGLTSRDGFPYPQVTVLDSTTVYRSDQSGFSDISSTPLLRDPYESKQVICEDSTVTGGGDGLFANKDLKPGTVVSFYNGVRFHDCHAYNDWESNSYKIRLNEKKKQILDIPVECRSLANYCATLAHKVNHSFTPNARFSDFAHPRFGRILCVKTTKLVRAGDELFCNYGYNLEDCPRWYRDLHDVTFCPGRTSILSALDDLAKSRQSKHRANH